MPPFSVDVTDHIGKVRSALLRFYTDHPTYPYAYWIEDDDPVAVKLRRKYQEAYGEDAPF